jgi:hypothetical protein
MPDKPPISERRITLWFLAAVAVAAVVSVGFELTPSSYGVFLNAVQAPDSGPWLGTSRAIRGDEWSVNTPLFQSAVRNRFQRVNETSFYREDLRNFVALPLKDWSLIFKPQLWAFFLLPPASAFSIYWALYMCAFLTGYHLLFRQLGASAGLACAGAVIVYFSGFTQFWWTTLGPLLAALPWILLIVLRPMPAWKKSLLCVWALPAFVFGYAYPALLITLGWGALIVILAYRPSLLRSPGNIVAIGAGIVSVALVLYFYYGDLISVVSNTVYPGRRVSRAGGTSVLAVLSEFFPFVSFRLGDYRHLDGENICEIGAVGSFLPLLTLCLMRYRSLRDHAAVRRTLLVLLTGSVAITLWELAPLPAWIGRVLFWDKGASERWLFTSGLLLTLAALLIWSNKLISVHPLRIGIFVVLGPIASIFLKIAWLIHQGEPGAVAFSACKRDILLCAPVLAVALGVWFVPAASRAALLLSLVAFINVYAFGGFNPVQPAGPIFDVPETDIVHALREKAAAAPGGVLADTQSTGATLNGLGLRSVSHVLMVPQLGFLRSYFPTMDAERFNLIFNRYAHIQVGQIPRPEILRPDVIQVPIEAFTPVRNARHLLLGPPQPGTCAQPPAGGVDRISSQGAMLTIDGWAPWAAETDTQGIRVLSARALRSEPLSTVQRPDLAERFQDYGFAKSGFQLRISSADGKPIRPKELVLLAFGTPQGEIRLSCCECP